VRDQCASTPEFAAEALQIGLAGLLTKAESALFTRTLAGVQQSVPTIAQAVALTRLPKDTYGACTLTYF
jgi:hypothetical protein